MKKFSKRAFIFLVTLFATSLSAQSSMPSFITLPATQVEKTSAYLRGQYSLPQEYTETEPVYIWFEYGRGEFKLSQKTLTFTQNGQGGIFSQKIEGLEPGMLYYYRTALKTGGIISYGQKRRFVTKGEYGEEAIYGQVNEDGSLADDDYLSSPLSFWELIGLKKKTDKKKDVPVNPEPSPDKEKGTVKKGDTSQENAPIVSPKNKKSAEYDDELGEVIVFASGKKKIGFKTSSLYGINYPLLGLIVFLLILLVVLVHLVLSKKRDVVAKKILAHDPLMEGKRTVPRYSIPIKCDVHDPRQNPNTNFFRKK